MLDVVTTQHIEDTAGVREYREHIQEKGQSRPPNCYVVFRMAFPDLQHRYEADPRFSSLFGLSRKTAALMKEIWETLKEEEGGECPAAFVKVSDDLEHLHHRTFPGYKFQPRSKNPEPASSTIQFVHEDPSSSRSTRLKSRRKKRKAPYKRIASTGSPPSGTSVSYPLDLALPSTPTALSPRSLPEIFADGYHLPESGSAPSFIQSAVSSPSGLSSTSAHPTMLSNEQRGYASVVTPTASSPWSFPEISADAYHLPESGSVPSLPYPTVFSTHDLDDSTSAYPAMLSNEQRDYAGVVNPLDDPTAVLDTSYLWPTEQSNFTDNTSSIQQYYDFEFMGQQQAPTFPYTDLNTLAYSLQPMEDWQGEYGDYETYYAPPRHTSPSSLGLRQQAGDFDTVLPNGTVSHSGFSYY